MQALSHAHHLGAGGRLLVYRLFLRDTVEERLLALSAERKRSLSSLIRPAAGRSSLEVGRCTSSCVSGSLESSLNASGVRHGYRACSQPDTGLNLSSCGRLVLFRACHLHSTQSGNTAKAQRQFKVMHVQDFTAKLLFCMCT